MLIWLAEAWHRSNGSPALDGSLWTSLGFRAVAAALLALLFTLVSGPWAIRRLRRRFREPNVGDSARLNALHAHKHATPTMGGLFLLGSLLFAIMLVGDWSNPYLPVVVLTVIGLGLLGIVDDLTKIAGRRNGLRPRTKLSAQTVVAAAVSLLAYQIHAAEPQGLLLAVPMSQPIELGLWFLPLATLVVVSCANAVNLTDGLDGLASGCLVAPVAVLGILLSLGGAVAVQSQAPWLPQASEMVVIAGGLLGALLGFLRFNRRPAQVFMGDTGSLPLGGMLGLLAIAARQELLLLVIGGVFVAEAGSVILQVGWYKRTRQRLFRCAPLHHHFQFGGWSETKVVRRFWLASTLCAALAIASLRPWTRIAELTGAAEPTIAQKTHP